MANPTIVAAFYGTQSNGSASITKVTEIVQALVSTGNDDIPINNGAMGGDPAVGHVKQFGVIYYQTNGSLVALTGTEGTVLDLVP